MDLVGYSDRLSVAPGETVTFMVSSRHEEYTAQLVRLYHGDLNPDGPGLREVELDSLANGAHRGRLQHLEPGSHAIIDDDRARAALTDFTVQAWVLPGTPGLDRQTVLSRADATACTGYALGLDESGALSLWLGDGEQGHSFSTGVGLMAGQWHFVSASHDTASGTIRLVQRLLRPMELGRTSATAEHTARTAIAHADAPLLIAGHRARTEDGRTVVRGHFNGKIDRPRLFDRALGADEVEQLCGWEDPRDVAAGSLVAAWDFAADIGTQRVTDTSVNGLHGRTVNLPMRAVTGANWTAHEVDWTKARSEYGAIRFHDDDLENAEWEPDFSFEVPGDLASGVYAMRLRAGGRAEDYLPFFVRPPRDRATAQIAFLAPTNSYLAYANEHYSWTNEEFAATTAGFGNPLERLQPQDEYMRDERLKSIYDQHADGSGVSTSSWLRPMVSLRPKFFMQLIRAPHQFNADLHLIDWLDAKGFEHDVITDHDLHAEGSELLGRYRVIVTGSHPEYWTEPMLDALNRYLEDGGRLMYMGGNGFYWVTAIFPELPHVIEVRRGHGGSRPWPSMPGEDHLAATGEPGSQWRLRGRPPQRTVGVGFTSQGSDVSVPFRRLPDSQEPRARFIFEGVGDDELIGDFGLVLGGAGGAEIDCFDHELGTPAHALRVATTVGFSDAYQGSLEDALFHDMQGAGGTVNPRVRADLTFFETPGDGAVFSTGSISWCGSLSHNGYDNNVSRITENVLRAFSADGPLPSG
jgi:N,N-dimethylformamidase